MAPAAGPAAPAPPGDPGAAAPRAGTHAWRFVAGLAVASALLFLPGVAALPWPARATAGVTVLTAWCWLSGALPLPVASLLPALLLPVTGAVSAAEVARGYFHDILMLFLGGFLLALALERYLLHERFALAALRLFGTRPRRLVLGLMLATGALSLFINNTSTALLMLPVAQALLSGCPPAASQRLAPPLLLGLAYACSIGGVGTPIGTAPNIIFLGQFRDHYPEAPPISFGAWVLGVLPFSLVFLLLTWWVLTRLFGPLPAEPVLPAGELARRRAGQGELNPAQKRTLAVFALVVALWVSRASLDLGAVRVPGWSELLPAGVAASLSDATVALFGLILLYLVPGAPGQGPLLGLEDLRRAPWDVLLLMGGGFALAAAFESTGLTTAMGEALRAALSGLSPLVAVLLTAAVVTVFSEVASNTAAITLLLPLLFSAAAAASLHPLLLALPATLAVSNAFMLPAGTPPNAIIFATGRVRMGQMARAGIVLDVLTVLLVTLFTLLWIAPLWGVDLRAVPDWAR